MRSRFIWLAITPVLAFALSACMSPVMLRNPQTGEVAQCLATGAFPLINQQQCVSAHENMGWVVTTPEEAQAAQAQVKAEYQDAQASCSHEMQAPDFDAIRTKIELFRAVADAPPPFAIASNDSFPTPAERPIIAKWATVRDNCLKSWAAIQPPSGNDLQAAVIQQDRSFATEVAGGIGELIIALYEGKLTYGEFAQKRYEIGRDGAAAERQFRAAALIADHERQLQEQQLAQEQFQNNLLAWSAYMQAVNTRQPDTVHLDCMTNRMGNFISTHCN